MGPINVDGVRGIVLAGTHQWSPSAFDRAAPRALLPVAGSPLICYALRWLRGAGVRDVAVCANSDSRHVRHHLADGARWHLALSYYEDQSPRGPAGCVRDAGLAWPARDLVVIEGTVIPGFDLTELLQTHRNAGAALTVVAKRMSGHDVVEPGLESAGVYVFSRAAVQAIPPSGYQDIKEMLIPRLHSQGLTVAVHETRAMTPRVTTPSAYLDLCGSVLQRMGHEGRDLSGYRRLGQAYVHVTATVADNARLYGPVLLGPDSHAADGARVIGPVTIGRGCRIAAGAAVCRSVIWDQADIGAGVLVDRCVVTSGVSLAPGSIWNATVLDGLTSGSTAAAKRLKGVRTERRRLRAMRNGRRAAGDGPHGHRRRHDATLPVCSEQPGA